MLGEFVQGLKPPAFLYHSSHHLRAWQQFFLVAQHTQHSIPALRLSLWPVFNSLTVLWYGRTMDAGIFEREDAPRS